MKFQANRLGRTAALLLVLAGHASSAKADVIFSNFGSNDGYDPFNASNVGYLIDFSLLRHVAVQFRVGSRPVFLDRIDLAMGFSSPPNVVDVEILRSVNGLPGPDSQTLEAFHLVNTLTRFGSTGPPLMIPSVLRPILDANTSYWLAAVTTRPTLDEWNNNIVGDMDTFAIRDNNGSWSALIGPPRPVFRILATPVAEPAAIGLLGVGALGLLGFWRSQAALRAAAKQCNPQQGLP